MPRRRPQRNKSNAVGIVIGGIVTAGFLLVLVVVFALQYEPPVRPTVTPAEYDAIKIGMTYDQVVNTVGMAGEKVYEYKVETATTAEHDLKLATAAYKWVNPSGTKVVCVMDAEGKVEGKAWLDEQTGIEKKIDELFE